MGSFSMYWIICACPEPTDLGLHWSLPSKSVHSCFGLHFHPQVQWREFQEDFDCCCFNRSYCSCNSQAVQPLQFAHFSLASFKFNIRPPPHCGGLGYVYVLQFHYIATPLVSVPKVFQMCFCTSRKSCRLCWLYCRAVSSMSVPCLMLVQGI